MAEKLKLILVDDHKLIRLGLRALTSGFEDIELVADCDFSHVLALVKEHHPNVVILNLICCNMPLNENIIREIIAIC
jgi:DNA-binding NarL/FixJ family response regulator